MQFFFQHVALTNTICGQYTGRDKVKTVDLMPVWVIRLLDDE